MLQKGLWISIWLSLSFITFPDVKIHIPHNPTAGKMTPVFKTPREQEKQSTEQVPPCELKCPSSFPQDGGPYASQFHSSWPPFPWQEIQSRKSTASSAAETSRKARWSLPALHSNRSLFSNETLESLCDNLCCINTAFCNTIYLFYSYCHFYICTM